MYKSFIVVSLLCFVSGCSVHGNDEFTCPNPEKGLCMPAEQAYKYAEQGKNANTLRNSVTIKKEISDDLEDEEETTGSDVNTGNKGDMKNYAPVVGVMSEPLRQPKPILEPAKVLKVWVNSWEDESGVLHMPQTAYVEIKPRRWNVHETKVHKFKSTSAFQKVR
jgi:conjugal transfer pilus assembly protein TraV